MSQRMLFQCTHGKEDPERAILPFAAANVAATAGIQATVVCTIDAVWLGTKGGADGVVSNGLPALVDLIEDSRANGGRIWLCGACTKPRGITEGETARKSPLSARQPSSRPSPTAPPLSPLRSPLERTFRGSAPAALPTARFVRRVAGDYCWAFPNA